MQEMYNRSTNVVGVLEYNRVFIRLLFFRGRKKGVVRVGYRLIKLPGRVLGGPGDFTLLTRLIQFTPGSYDHQKFGKNPIGTPRRKDWWVNTLRSKRNMLSRFAVSHCLTCGPSVLTGLQMYLSL